MSTLTGTIIANTYKQLLQVGTGNVGLTSSLQTVQDGVAANSPLQLSTDTVNINGTFQLSGITLTASASTLNAVADLTGATGIVAVSAGNVYGRTLTAGTGITIGNGSGTEGNPTIAMVTATTSGSYKGPNDIEVNAVGQIVSISPAVSVSVATIKSAAFEGGTFVGSSGGFETNVSMGGDLVVRGDATLQRIVVSAIDLTRLSATSGEFSGTVSAGFFAGDGRFLVNVPSTEQGTMRKLTSGTGINLTIDGVVSTTIITSGTVNLNANQSFGIVSATNIDADELLVAGVSVATVTEVAAVSVLTSVNLAAITSITAINTQDVTLTGTPDYITISNQVITRNQVDLAADVTGNLPISNLNSGTGASGTSFWRGDGSWAAPTGTGDVVGPASSTDNAITRFDSTTGNILQNSTATISDTGDVIIAGNLSVGATVNSGSGVIENSATIATSITITSGSNAISVGPMTINSGITVTLPSGSRWVVL
jgi:hypothetical protein